MAKQKPQPPSGAAPSFPAFISKQPFRPSDVGGRVKGIDWCASVGRPSEFLVTMPVARVKNWADAMKAARSTAWDRAILEARNQLTAALHRLCRERYGDWNRLANAFKSDVITPLTKTAWEPYQRLHQLDEAFVHCTQWNILAALMENAYIDAGHGSYFFLELLTIYEAGHFPCGWRGRWPEGTLVVY